VTDSGDSRRAIDGTEPEAEVGLLFSKLKPGPGMSAEEVAADQRRRLHGAIIALVDAKSWEDVRVRSVARVAGVSTTTFYKHFANADQCFASAFDAAMGGALRRSASAGRGRREWRTALRSAVRALLTEFAEEPRSARVTLLDVFSAGPGARRRIGHAVAELEEVVASSLRTEPRPPPAPRRLVAGMAAGTIRVARQTTAAGRGAELPGLADDLVEWMLCLPHAEIGSLLQGAGASAADGREPKPFPDTTQRIVDGAVVDERERLLRAAAKVATADGFAGLTTRNVRAEAGVSRRGFDATFDDLDQCFLAAVETIAEESVVRASAWAAGVEDWRIRICRAILALCAQAARDQSLARVTFLEIFRPGRPGLLRRERLIGRATTALLQAAPPGQRPSQVAAEASVAAAWRIAHADIAAGRARQLPRIAPLLSYVVLAPIVGAESAGEAIRSSGSINCGRTA